MTKPIEMPKARKRAPRPGEGRPKLTTAALPDNWKETILEKSAEGCSAVEIRAHLCMIRGTFDHTTWDALIERESEFSTTVKKGQALCQAWWERTGRENLKTEHFQTGLWTMNMKNRFGWQEKVEVNHGMTDELLEKFKSKSNNDLIAEGARLAREVLAAGGDPGGSPKAALPQPA